MKTIIVTGQATTDALSGSDGVSNMITLYDAPKIRDVVSARIVSRYDASGRLGSIDAPLSGEVVSIGASGVITQANLYPVARTAIGSGTGTSGKIIVCSGVTASGATVQILTCSGMADTVGDQLEADHMLVLQVSTRGEVVRV